MATRAKQRKAEQPEAEQPAFKPDYGAVLKEVSKKFKTSSGSMSLEARLSCTVSTGLLSSDLMLGGGLVAGRWYTVFGGEGSAKSTHVAHIKIAAADLDVPVMQDLDYEGSSDPIYYEGIMEFYSKMRKITDLYGLKDEASGEWIIQPRVDYQQVTVAEDFFNPAAALLRRIPDKVYVDGRWWYSWTDDKYGRGMSKGQHSPAMLREHNRLMIEAENGLPQAIYFLDSYPAMYPDRLDEDDAGSGMAAVARAMAENIPKVLGKLRPKGVIIVGVNQLRQRPAVMYGSPEYEPGGETLKFASSVRVRQAARSVPHGKGPIEEEDSVLYERAKDQYRYIHMKAIKNKVSTPYLESWQRVWVNDGAGQAHGFDPVWDTFQFLKTTGQLGAGSTMKKLKIPALGLDKPISWLDFKELVLLRGNDLKSVCRDLGITKPPKLRDMGFKQLATGQAQRMFFEHQRGAESDESDED